MSDKDPLMELAVFIWDIRKDLNEVKRKLYDIEIDLIDVSTRVLKIEKVLEIE